MAYIENRMQDQIETDIALKNELEIQYQRFCRWYLVTFPNADESLIERKYLDSKFNLCSPVVEVSALWLGWRKALSI